MGYLVHPSSASIPVHKVRALIGRSIIQKHDPYFDLYREPDDITPEPGKEVSLCTISLYEALACYNGTADFDCWLNHHATTWTKVNIIRTILTKRNMPWREFLFCIGLQDNDATRGMLMGKIDAMGAICLIRELFIKSRYALDTRGEKSLYRHLIRLNQYLRLTTDDDELFRTLKKNMRLFNTQDHLEIALLVHFLPSGQAMYVKHEFKRRVIATMVTKFIQLLRESGFDTEYKVHYCLGFLARLYDLDLNDSQWTDSHYRKPLYSIVHLYQKAILWDADFISDTFTTVMSRLMERRPFQIYPLYVWYVYRLIHHAACKSIVENELRDKLHALRKDINISVSLDDGNFSWVYWFLPNHDLSWAHDELPNVIKVNFIGKD